MRAVFEAELEGDSVFIWEAGSGTRVIYPTPQLAEVAHAFLLDLSRRFYDRKDADGVYSVYVYGDEMTPYEMIQRYYSLCSSAGLVVQKGCQTRPPVEYW